MKNASLGLLRWREMVHILDLMDNQMKIIFCIIERSPAERKSKDRYYGPDAISPVWEASRKILITARK